MQPSLLRVEPFASVDVADLVSWVGGVPFSEWPQQHPLHDGQLRPAMVSDPAWHGFKERVSPLVSQLMGSFPGADADTFLLSVVMPGHSIEPHKDLQSPRWQCRVHVPLTSNEGSAFIMEGKVYWMEVGTAYAVNTEREHAVTNDGETPRIHFMFDVRKPHA